MASSYFQFKQFTIHHDRATMKVGTDGVLLGAWAKTDHAKKILDIGTGSGLIALMLGQRTASEVCIDAVEIELRNAEQALENVKLSPWKNKIEIHHTSIQNFSKETTYDLIVSNPPYFQNSYQPPDEKRTIARHTVTLTFLDLIAAVKRMLNDNGSFNVILPQQEGLEFIELMRQANFHCTRKWNFRTRIEKPIERLLLEFKYHPEPIEEGEIILYAIGDNWSANYIQLTKEFYLKI